MKKVYESPILVKKQVLSTIAANGSPVVNG